MPTIAEIYKTIQTEEAAKEEKAAQMLNVPSAAWSEKDLNQLGLTPTPIQQILAMRVADAPNKEKVILAICRLQDRFTILRAVQEPLSITGWVRIDSDKPGNTSQRLADLYQALSADERRYLGIKDSELVAAACIVCGLSLTGEGDARPVGIRIGQILNFNSSVCETCEKPLAKILFDLIKDVKIPEHPKADPGLQRNIIL